MLPESLQLSVGSADQSLKDLKWDVFVEKAGIWGEADFVKSGLVDHINTTKFTTDYLWYTTRFVSAHLEKNNGLVYHLKSFSLGFSESSNFFDSYDSFNGSILVGENEEFLKKGSSPVLLLESKGHAVHAFVNQELQGYFSCLNDLWSVFKMKASMDLLLFLFKSYLICRTRYFDGTFMLVKIICG